MAGEQIPLAFDGTQALAILDVIEGRLSRIGQQAGSMPIGAAGSAGGGGGAGAAAVSLGGGGGGSSSSAGGSPGLGGLAGGGFLGAVAKVLTGASEAMGGAIANQNPMAVGEGLLGGINQASALHGAFDAAKKGADFISNIPGGEVFGGLAKAKLRSVESSTFQPVENAQARLSSVVGQLGRAGIGVSDKDLDLGMHILYKQERQAYENQKRLAQLNASSGILMDSFSFAVTGH